MKVKDAMSTVIDYVSPKTSVKDVCRLIFGRGINGVPVCKGRKVIGFITEKDILDKFYPSMQEYMEDPVHTINFEEMEEKVSEIFSLTAEKIMSKNPTTITQETPLLRAQSLMTVRKVGRLPVVDEKGNIFGMISKGDIFRAAVGDKLPYASEEEYHDWLSKHYDLIVPWEERLGKEVPDLTGLFRKERVENVVDIGCGTGEHDIALAKNGFHVLGIETSPLMYEKAQEKVADISPQIAQRVQFVNGDYTEVLNDQSKQFGAAMFMGNAFPHIADNYKEVLPAISNSLLEKNSLMVLQIVNFEKVFKGNKRFLDLNFGKSKVGLAQEHAFLEFYDPPRNRSSFSTLNMAIFDFDGKKWKFRSMNSTPIVNLDRQAISKLLKKHGFNKISFYGGKFLGSLFKEEFRPLESDWLNVVARR